VKEVADNRVLQREPILFRLRTCVRCQPGTSDSLAAIVVGDFGRQANSVCVHRGPAYPTKKSLAPLAIDDCHSPVDGLAITRFGEFDIRRSTSGN